ncbi:MAG: hypothetical protein Q8P18_17830 [Pseudomonadota bacterium]|nr:hypothetical protein [Pseudomonadota bacterium]
MWLALASLAAQTLVVALVPSGHAAASCDVKGLSKALVDAAPNQAGKAFADLAGCDPAAAKAAAPEAFKKILAGDSGDAAVVVAVSIGAGESVRSWVNAQEPDDRSRTISKLGEKCDQAGVPAFFLETQTALGDKFWTERWYRGLDDCRDPAVQELLRARITDTSGDRALYNGVLEVYARNLGKNAIPTLKAAAAAEKDAEVSGFIIDAFTNASGVGREGGPDQEAVKLAVASINEVAPLLPEKTIDKARTTLLSLGAEADSDRLAGIRYKNMMQPSGGLLYGVFTTETATCKKGDVKVVLHHAPVNEAGRTWPDQVNERIQPALLGNFDLDLAKSCKGTGTNETATPPAPFKDAAAYQAWVDEMIREFQKKNPAVKAKIVAEDPLTL